MAMSDEQRELIDHYLCELNRKGEFHSTSDRQIAADLLEKYGDKLINPAIGKPFNERTIRSYIESFIDNWLSDGRAFTRGVTKKLMYAAEQLADEAATSPQAYKVLAEKFVPNKHDTQFDKPAVSPLTIEILDRPGVGRAIRIGKDAYITREGDSGHECPDSGDTVADESRHNTAPEAVSSGHDSPVRGGDTGEQRTHTPQGASVSDTSVSPEDSTDNDGGGGLDVT
jgi:hypothetical protein